MRPAIAVALVAAAAAAGYWLGASKESAHQPAPTQASAEKNERKVLYYRNPMGLPDTSPVPKKDPMGMDYIPVYEGEEPAKAGSVKISPDKIQLLGVRTEAAAERELRRTVQAVGTIQANERLLAKVTPRFEGYIEKLYVNTTGQAVKRGEALMEVYSPEIVAAQEEYLIAKAGGTEPVMQRMAEAVLQRLRNWGIAESELETLRKEGKARRSLTLRSPAAGAVLAKPSVQGMRFMPGETLYEIADLSAVWLVAEIFERDLGLVKAGQAARLRILAYPEREFTGKVVFVYPTLDPNTRTGRVRIELPNPAGLLKPAMYGNVELEGGRARGKALAIPDSAVLDSGSRQVVLVQRAEGQFEPRDVKLGTRAEGYVEVLDGVSAGEQVVVRANFLIDAESNLKAALESFGKAAAPLHAAHGTVAEINASSGTLTIEHGAVPSLKWPPMTMEFRAKDRALLQDLKPGQHIEFEFSEQSGDYVVERVK
ncbi:MAG TPA: efflux RND transporter periplasmic adaptor subunit [Burkholderiales bacterium]